MGKWTHWTPKEDTVLRSVWPDRKLAKKLLKGRTPRAICGRAELLRLNPTNRITVTAADQRRMCAAAARNSTYAEVAKQVGIKTRTVRSHLRKLGVHFDQRSDKLTGVYLYDEVRRYCRERRIRYCDVDLWLGYRAQCLAKPNNLKAISTGMICNAIFKLGGELVAVWEDE